MSNETSRRPWKLLDHLGGYERMICQPLNPPQRSIPLPGPESCAVLHGERGAPIGRSSSGARNRRPVWFGRPHRGSAGGHRKRKRPRCARGDEQALASQRPRDSEIALGESEIKSTGGLLPAARERFLCDWFGVVCECWRVDYAAKCAPEYSLARRVNRT